ncbi:hypothetical protein BOSE46_90559 [Bosea sp. 46]|nr:hypothetical protein BOSE46_90559 [Bosea sp. 46]
MSFERRRSDAAAREDMMGKQERSLGELYGDDPERGDALAFGRRTGSSRRGFLGGAGLAAMGAAVGGAIPFSDTMPAGLIPAALAQGPGARHAPSLPRSVRGPGSRRSEGPAVPRLPRQGQGPRPARRPAARRRDAGAHARRRHHAVREVLRPQQRPDAGRIQGR